MDDIDLKFSRVLKQLRKANGLTQEALSQRAGIDYKYLQKLEGNKPSSPTLSTMNKLSNGLKISLTELIGALMNTDD